MQGGTKREVVSWKLAAALFWWFRVILNVLVCNMLLQIACKNHQNSVRKTDEHGLKWSQNLTKIDPLEATWEPPLKQGASKTSFLTMLAPFWDPLWGQFGLILRIMFLIFFWSGLLMALASIWAPKRPPKWDPKDGQHQNLKIIDFVSIYDTLATFRGAENHNSPNKEVRL